jgi:hypothetical protein
MLKVEGTKLERAESLRSEHKARRVMRGIGGEVGGVEHRSATNEKKGAIVSRAKTLQMLAPDLAGAS